MYSIFLFINLIKRGFFSIFSVKKASMALNYRFTVTSINVGMFEPSLSLNSMSLCCKETIKK